MTKEEAIKRYCLQCMNHLKNEVKLCPSTDCPLYKNRFGGSEGNKTKRIIARCEDCTEGLLKNCKFKDCPLFEFRIE
ncbi:MAG: hypothetical protein ABH824_00425 [Nanoarchaeota archaeon]